MKQVIFSTLMLLALSGCGDDPLPYLRSPKAMTIFSIDGRDPHQRSKHPVAQADTGETFNKYPVLGKVEIQDAGQRQKIVAALKDAIAQKDLHMPNCFWPRHGLRVVEQGRTEDFVICFECVQFEEFTNGNWLRTSTIGRSVRPALEKPLKDAGVALAPESH
jgi:hypothetical protein